MRAAQRLSATAVRDRLADSPDTQLLDVREPWEFELARLPGARLVPLAELPSRWRELDPRLPVIVYCHHGVRSWHAACFLVAQGLTDVHDLEGGLEAWSRNVDPAFPCY